MVVNSGNKWRDVEHMQKIKQEFKYEVEIEHLLDHGLIALQGPKAVSVLERVLGPQSTL